MVENENAYAVCPIGVVRSAIKQPADDCWAGLVSVIELDPQLFTVESTVGLGDFSHAEVVKPYLQEFASRQQVRQAARSKQLMASYFKPPK